VTDIAYAFVDPRIQIQVRVGRSCESASLRSTFVRPRWLTVPVAAGTLLVLFWVAVALTVQWWPIDDPVAFVGTRLAPPSVMHWLGTDALGRDVVSRTLHGAQYSLPVALAVILSAVGIGATLGAFSGFLGGLAGRRRHAAGRYHAVLPAIMLAMAVTASLGPGCGTPHRHDHRVVAELRTVSCARRCWP